MGKKNGNLTDISSWSSTWYSNIQGLYILKWTDLQTLTKTCTVNMFWYWNLDKMNQAKICLFETLLQSNASLVQTKWKYSSPVSSSSSLVCSLMIPENSGHILSKLQVPGPNICLRVLLLLSNSSVMFSLKIFLFCFLQEKFNWQKDE